jgi:hypothetical protein
MDWGHRSENTLGIERITMKDDRLVEQAAATHRPAAPHAYAPALMQMLAPSLGASGERDELGARQFHGQSRC